MKISVILSTYNQPGHLDLVLHGYGVQDDANFEVVIADDGSSDATRQVIESHRGRWAHSIRHVWQEDEGFRKTRILNKAIEASEGSYLIFSDGDCVPRREYVRMHRTISEKGRYVTGAYNRLPRGTTDRVTPRIVTSQKLFSPLWMVMNGFVPTRGLVRLIVPSRIGYFLDGFGSVEYGRFTGGNASCFKEDAIAVGGFNESMSWGMEDREFGTRLCNSGIMPKRLKNATYVLHLDHDRPYADEELKKRNKEILTETEQSRRTSLQPGQH